MSLLERCNGPECPRCGCQDAYIISTPKVSVGTISWWGAGRARCNHCRLVFSFRELPAPAPAVVLPAVVDEPEAADISHEIPPFDPSISVTDDVVEALPPAVPTCEVCSGTLKVSSTRKTHRWYKCVLCGKTMKIAR